MVSKEMGGLRDSQQSPWMDNLPAFVCIVLRWYFKNDYGFCLWIHLHTKTVIKTLNTSYLAEGPNRPFSHDIMRMWKFDYFSTNHTWEAAGASNVIYIFMGKTW